ncbi:5439_t:CDS:1, partial [Ambispora gerdemannii]
MDNKNYDNTLEELKSLKETLNARRKRFKKYEQNSSSKPAERKLQTTLAPHSDKEISLLTPNQSRESKEPDLSSYEKLLLEYLTQGFRIPLSLPIDSYEILK